jgi:hypothetical protein
MLVPKAAVYEDDLASLPQNDVRITWKVLSVQSVAEAEFPDHPPHDAFRIGVLLSDAAHHPGANFR